MKLLVWSVVSWIVGSSDPRTARLSALVDTIEQYAQQTSLELQQAHGKRHTGVATSFVEDVVAFAKQAELFAKEANFSMQEVHDAYESNPLRQTRASNLCNSLVPKNDERPVEQHPTWFSSLSTCQRQQTLKHFTVVQTHDAGAYELNKEWDTFDNSYQSIKKIPVVGWLPDSWIAYFACRFSITQSQSIYKQLQGGVRSFDLRVNWDPKKQLWRIAHGLFGPTIQDIVNQIGAFTTTPESQHEIIILKMSTFHGNPSTAEKQVLVDMILEAFQEIIITADMDLNKLSIAALTEEYRKRILILVNNESVRNMGGKYFRSSSGWSMGWPRQIDAEGLYKFSAEKVQKFQQNYQPVDIDTTAGLHGFSWTLTPTEGWIATKLVFGHTIYTLVADGNTRLNQFWQDMTQHYVKETLSPQLAHEVGIDYFEHSSAVALSLAYNRNVPCN